MPLVKVKPADGARIRQPNRNFRVMPLDGDTVDTADSFYNRLITSGDLLVVQEEPKPNNKKPPPAKTDRK